MTIGCGCSLITGIDWKLKSPIVATLKTKGSDEMVTANEWAREGSGVSRVVEPSALWASVPLGLFQQQTNKQTKQTFDQEDVEALGGEAMCAALKKPV